MKKTFILLLGVAALGACKKDSENTPSKTDMLTSGKWKISAATTTSTVAIAGSTPTTSTTDQFASMQTCEKDNFYKFNTDKTMVMDEGATKCSSSSPQTSAFTWDFNSDQSKLLVTPKGSTSTSTDEIVELSASTMRLRETNTYSASGSTLTTVSDVTFKSF